MKGFFKARNWRKLEQGQALVEYWPTIPVAIAVTICSALLVNFLNGAFFETYVGLTAPYCSTQDIDTSTDIFQHRIETAAVVYDFGSDRTTLVYKVTSGTQPSISHWILGVPKEVADRVLQTSEAWEWTDSDPTTGASGMKFDVGYNPGGGGNGDNGGNGGNGGNQNDGGNGGNGGNGDNGGNGGNQNDGGNGGNGKGKNQNSSGIDTFNQGYRLISTRLVADTTSPTEVRTIAISLDGWYEFGSLTVTIKAGSTQVGSGTVSGPTAPTDGSGGGGSSSSGNGSNSGNGKGC